MWSETLLAYGFAALFLLTLANSLAVGLLALRLPAYRERTEKKLTAKSRYKSDELCLLERIADIYRAERTTLGVEWTTKTKKPDRDPKGKWDLRPDASKLSAGRVVLLKGGGVFRVRFGTAEEYEFEHFEQEAAARVYHDAQAEIRAHQMMLIAEGNGA